MWLFSPWGSWMGFSWLYLIMTDRSMRLKNIDIQNIPHGFLQQLALYFLGCLQPDFQQLVSLLPISPLSPILIFHALQQLICLEIIFFVMLTHFQHSYPEFRNFENLFFGFLHCCLQRFIRFSWTFFTTWLKAGPIPRMGNSFETVFIHELGEGI